MTQQYILSRSSVLLLEYKLQRKRKWSVFSVSTPHLHIGSTVSLKPCLNLCSFKWLKFNLRCVSSLRPLVSCIAKTEFSLDLIKLMIVSLNLFTDTMFRISALSAHHCLIMLRYNYTAQETVTSFLTFLEILWFLLNCCYILHHITCDTTGKVAREIGEIGPWRCFSYFVSWILESRLKVRKR